MTEKNQHIVRLERGEKDRILPKDFSKTLVMRFLPVLSLIYIASVVGVALNKHDIVHYLFFDRTAYVSALFVVVWVSIPAMTWILLRGSMLYYHVADVWYKILAGLMVVTIALSFLLFPEADLYGLRVYFILSIPLFVLVYFLLVKDGLYTVFAMPLNVLGFCALLYGAAVNVVF